MKKPSFLSHVRKVCDKSSAKYDEEIKEVEQQVGMRKRQSVS